jgi:hypothetical protein
VKRHRDIAAAPQRGAATTWEAITCLIADTLDRSASIDRAEVETAMRAAAPVGRHLVAGGHLDRQPLTLIAEPVYCTISTVSGTAALSLEENLNPIPGGGSAETFMIYLPAPAVMAQAVKDAAKTSPHLSADVPPEPADEATAARTRAGVGMIDLDALAQRKAQRS